MGKLFLILRAAASTSALTVVSLSMEHLALGLREGFCRSTARLLDGSGRFTPWTRSALSESSEMTALSWAAADSAAGASD